MAWFQINADTITESSANPWASENGKVWGRYLGGRWCLDYSFKLAFDLSSEDWENRCGNLRNEGDLYALFEWLGVYYMRMDGYIYRRGGRVDKFGKPIVI